MAIIAGKGSEYLADSVLLFDIFQRDPGGRGRSGVTEVTGLTEAGFSRFCSDLANLKEFHMISIGKSNSTSV